MDKLVIDLKTQQQQHNNNYSVLFTNAKRFKHVHAKALYECQYVCNKHHCGKAKLRWFYNESVHTKYEISIDHKKWNIINHDKSSYITLINIDNKQHILLYNKCYILVRSSNVHADNSLRYFRAHVLSLRDKFIWMVHVDELRWYQSFRMFLYLSVAVSTVSTQELFQVMFNAEYVCL